MKYRDFLKIWLGNLISRLGDSIDAIAFMWMIYELTGSSVLMGTILAVNFLPNVIFGMFADRWNITGNIKPWYLYIITFINS